jgi:hypothetical protein
MRTACQTVQHAHEEGRMRVAAPPNQRWTALSAEVIVRHPAVRVRSGVDLQGGTESPESQRDERAADQAFAPRRNHVKRRQQVAEEYGQHGDEDDSRRMANSPREPGCPAAAPVRDRQRRDCGKMVGARQHVDQAGKRARENRQHCTDLICRYSSSPYFPNSRPMPDRL